MKGQAKRLMERRELVAGNLPPFSEIVRGSLVTRYRRAENRHAIASTRRGTVRRIIW